MSVDSLGQRSRGATLDVGDRVVTDDSNHSPAVDDQSTGDRRAAPRLPRRLRRPRPDHDSLCSLRQFTPHAVRMYNAEMKMKVPPKRHVS